MRICRDLGLTLEQGMEMSQLEFKLWVAYYTMEHKEQKKVEAQNGRRKHNR